MNFRQLRFGVSFIGNISEGLTLDGNAKDIARVHLNAAKREYARTQDLLEKGVASRAELDAAKAELDSAQKRFDSLDDVKFPNLNIFAVEGTEEMPIITFYERQSSRSFLIDSPPPKVSVKVAGKGMYSIYVWASL